MIQTSPAPSPLWIVLALWAAGLGAAAQFGKFSVVYDLAPSIWPLAGATALGLLISVVGFPGLILGTTAGIIVQSLGYRRVLCGALLAGAGFSLLQAALLPLWLMMVLRVCEGLSHLAIVVAAPVMIAQSTPPARQGLAMTLWSTFFALAYTALALLGRPLALAWGVPALLVAHAGWMLAVALLLARLLPRDGPAQRPDLAPGPLWRRHVAIYRSPWIAAPAMGFVCYTISYVALLTLLPPMAAAELRQILAGLMPLVSIVVSLSLGVWLLGRMGAVRVVALGFALSLPGALAWWWLRDLPLAQMLAGLWLGGALGLVQGASFAAIPVLNPGQAERAMAAGAVAQLGNVGTTLGTPLLSWLIVTRGPGAVPVFVLVFALCGMALHLWQARRRAAEPL